MNTGDEIIKSLIEIHARDQKCRPTSLYLRRQGDEKLAELAQKRGVDFRYYTD